MRRAALAFAAVVLGGCANFSDDGGFGAVERAARERTGQEVRWLRDDAQRAAAERRVAELLARPLSADGAVQVALLNQPGLQAAFFELGVVEADLVQAGLLPNPGFGFARLTRGDEVELERSLHFSLARLVALPFVRQLEQRRFAQAQGTAALAVLTLASDVRRAWVQAVAAAESVRYARQVMDAAAAGAELARRMAQAGNFNRLQRAREQGFHADAALQLARAEHRALAARERLTRLLGLWGDDAARFSLPERLPDLPAAPADRPDIEREALAQRLDVQSARQATELTARALGLTKTTRFVNVFELGVVRNTSNEAPPQRGWEIGFELPLFDWGSARVARAESLYRQSLARAAQTAIDARSEVREAYAAYRSAWDIARFQRDEVVPLAARVSEENLLRYNGMLIGVFELLADARAQIASVNTSIDALRDFWLAETDLQQALVGRPALAPFAEPAAASAADPAPH